MFKKYFLKRQSVLLMLYDLLIANLSSFIILYLYLELKAHVLDTESVREKLALFATQKGRSFKKDDYVYDGKKKIFSEMGELLFTHFGISGPLGLSASCKITERLQNFETFRAEIDLKTALTEQQLKDRIIKDTEENPKKMVKSLLPKYLPGKMAEVFEEILPFDTAKNCADLSKEDAKNIYVSIQNLPLCLYMFQYKTCRNDRYIRFSLLSYITFFACSVVLYKSFCEIYKFWIR